MSKFKVGDRVFVSNPMLGYECQKNFKFVIEKVEFNYADEDSYRGNGVDSEGTISSNWYYGEGELSLDVQVKPKYEYSLLALCEELHMFSNGSHETTQEDINTTYETVKDRLKNWESSDRKSSQYDSIVKNLCERVVKEYELTK